DPELGADAARAIEQWAGPDDAPALIAGLDSDNASVRTSLFRTLGRLRAEAAIPVLVKHLAMPRDRVSAMRALREIGPKVAPEIRPLLASDDPDTRRQVANLIRQIGANEPGLRVQLAMVQVKGPNEAERGF